MLQPQEQETPGEYDDSLIKTVENLFKTSTVVLERHVADLEGFREAISKKVLSVCKEMEELKEMFKEFENAQAKKVNNMPIMGGLKEV